MKLRNQKTKRWMYTASITATDYWFRLVMRNMNRVHCGIMLESGGFSELLDGRRDLSICLVQCVPFIRTYDESLNEIRKCRSYDTASFRDVRRIHALIRLAKRQAKEQTK